MRWRFKTGVDPSNGNQQGMQASAAVMNGVVYFGCRDAHLYAVDARTGKQRWAFDAKGAWVNTTPTVRDGKVYFGTADGRTFYVLEATNGNMHLTLKKEATRPAGRNFLQQQAKFDSFMHCYNFDRPHQAIGMTRPSCTPLHLVLIRGLENSSTHCMTEPSWSRLAGASASADERST